MTGELKIRTFDEIEAEDVRWLWKPYIAYGKLTVIQGDPGHGKTALALAIAALISQRRQMPTGGAKPIIGNVLFQTGEDGTKDTIKPRLEACKADCSKIAFVENEGGLNVKMFEEAIRLTNAKYAVIDPLQAFLSANQDLSSAKNMRPLLRELGNVAERTGAAIVLIGHMNKKDGTKSIYRGLGSIDIAAAARSVLLIGKSRNDENVRFMAQIKNNLTSFGKAISFTINQRGGVKFLGECDVSEEELLSTAAEEKKSKFLIAKETVMSMLSEGDKRSNEIYDACLNKGVSIGVIQRVKRELGIKSEYKNDDWHWTLNPQAEDADDTDDFLPKAPAAESDETPVLYMDDISTLTQLSVVPDRRCSRSDRAPEKAKSHSRNINRPSGKEILPPFTTMRSPFGELELMDWRACM